MRLAPLTLAALVVVSPLTMGLAAAEDHDMPEVQKVRFCERVRDFALQAFFDREKGRPMKVFQEDGSAGPRITNHIIRHIYCLSCGFLSHLWIQIFLLIERFLE